jgi:hypothetical protein
MGFGRIRNDCGKTKWLAYQLGLGGLDMILGALFSWGERQGDGF